MLNILLRIYMNDIFIVEVKSLSQFEEYIIAICIIIGYLFRQMIHPMLRWDVSLLTSMLS